jgi:polysaccharide biosynthesis protein PelC
MSGCKHYFFIALGWLSVILSGCTSMQVDHSQPVAIPSSQKIAVLPFVNLTETPQANERAAAIAAQLFRSKGMTQVVSYPLRQGKLTFVGVKASPSRETLLAWAMNKHANYALNGSVSEWNYKVGLDGEPVVGVNLEIIDLNRNKVIWSAVGSKSGGSATALTTVAQQLLSSMLSSVVLTRS